MTADIKTDAPMVTPFLVIELGHGKVEMGDAIHDGRLPALWFGRNGQGMGFERIRNNYTEDGETLAVVTFANVEGLDVLLEVIQRIRAQMVAPGGFALSLTTAEHTPSGSDSNAGTPK